MGGATFELEKEEKGLLQGAWKWTKFLNERGPMLCFPQGQGK